MVKLGELRQILDRQEETWLSPYASRSVQDLWQGERDNLRQIVEIEIEKVADRLKDHNLRLEATEPALDELATEGYDPDMGARPLRRVIQQKVEDPLSDRLLSGEFADGAFIQVDVSPEGEITLEREQDGEKAEAAV